MPPAMKGGGARRKSTPAQRTIHTTHAPPPSMAGTTVISTSEAPAAWRSSATALSSGRPATPTDSDEDTRRGLELPSVHFIHLHEYDSPRPPAPDTCTV